MSHQKPYQSRPADQQIAADTRSYVNVDYPKPYQSRPADQQIAVGPKNQANVDYPKPYQSRPADQQIAVNRGRRVNVDYPKPYQTPGSADPEVQRRRAVIARMQAELVTARRLAAIRTIARFLILGIGLWFVLFCGIMRGLSQAARK